MESGSELDIGRYLRLIYKRRVLFAATAMTITTLVVVVSYFLPKVYEAKSTIFIERNYLNDLMKDITVTPSFDEKIKALSTVLKSRNLLMKVVSDLDLDLNGKSPEQIEAMIKRFQEKTVISTEFSRMSRGNMDLFTVSYRDSDPTLVCNYVNLLVRRYIESSLSSKREEAYEANRFIMEQIDSFKKKISQTESEIARLSSNPDVLAADRLQQLQKKLQQLQVQYTEGHPEVMKVKMEIEDLKKSRPKAARLRARPATPPSGAAEATAGKGDAAASSTASDVAPGTGPLRDLERERDSIKKIYEELLAMLSKSEVSTQVEIQDKAGAFKILDPAVVPQTPISPNIPIVILLAVAAGIGAGIAVVVGMDYLDTSVHSVETVKGLGLPVLAVIPAIQTREETTIVKKTNLILYTALGLYLTCLLAIVTLEVMNVHYLDNLASAAKAGVADSLKKNR